MIYDFFILCGVLLMLFVVNSYWYVIYKLLILLFLNKKVNIEYFVIGGGYIGFLVVIIFV